MVRKPAAQKLLLSKSEVVEGQAQCISHGREALLRELGHDVDLAHRFVIVELQRLKVGLREASPLRPQLDGHGRAEHCESPVEPDDLLLVQPHQGAVHELAGVLDLPLQAGVALDRLHQLPQRRLG